MTVRVPVTEFWFAPHRSDGELARALADVEAARHAGHDRPDRFCRLCPPPAPRDGVW